MEDPGKSAPFAMVTERPGLVLACSAAVLGSTIAIYSYFRAVAKPRVYFDMESAQSRALVHAMPLLQQPYWPTPWYLSLSSSQKIHIKICILFYNSMRRDGKWNG